MSLSTSNNNDIKLIKESYKNLKLNDEAIINTDQGSVYFAYEYFELTKNIGFTRSMSHRGTVGKIVQVKIGLCVEAWMALPFWKINKKVNCGRNKKLRSLV